MRTCLLTVALFAVARSLRMPSTAPRPTLLRAATAGVSSDAAQLKAALDSLCSTAPPNGVGADEALQAEVESAITELEPLCCEAPAQRPLEGVFDLVYTSAKGGSNGKVGPFVGAVTQTFVDDRSFINAVDFFGGAVKLSLYAEREIIDDERIRVKFRETGVQVFGNEIVRKKMNGAGVWKQRYVDDEIRIMNTPSVFILRKRGT